MSTDEKVLQQIVTASRALQPTFEQRANGATVSTKEASAALSAFMKRNGQLTDQTFAALALRNKSVATKLENVQNLSSLSEDDRRRLRTDFYLISGSLTKLIRNRVVTDPTFIDTAAKYRTSLDGVTNFIPL